jgi:uncharacterized protein YecT (DUF1311 family)
MSCAIVSAAGAQDAPYKYWQDAEPAQYAWVLEYAGKPATAMMADARFAHLRDHPLSILKAKADLGDPPKGSTLVRDEILSALGGVPDPVQTRLGRYAILSGCRTKACTDRVFIWVDTLRGIVLTMLLVPPSEELPGTNPSVILASRLLNTKWIHPDQLPERFWIDWQEWAYAKNLPEVMTQRMVNTYGGFSVMFHDDENVCADAIDTYSANICSGNALGKAQADLDALLAQVRRQVEHFESDLSGLEKSQKLWEEYRKTACDAAADLYKGGTAQPSMRADCERQLTHDRVRALDRMYYMALYD